MNPQAPPFTPSAKSKANLQDKMAHYDGLLSGCGAFGCLYHGLSGCNTSKVSMGGAMFNGGKEAPGAGAAKFSSVTDEAPRTVTQAGSSKLARISIQGELDLDMSGGLGKSRWAPSGCLPPFMSVTAPNIPTVEPFDLSNEERSQQAFQARLKELKEAMVTGAAGKGNGSPVVQGARGPVVKRENFSPAKFVSATAIEAQPSAAQQAETHLLISKADLDSIVQLLSETRLSIKDENDETQQVSYDIVMSNLEDVHTKCDAFLAAMLEVQDGVGNAKAAFNELVEAQNHATEASRAKWAVLASQFDSVLDNVETSLRKACIQVPRTNEIAPEQDTVDGDFNKEHVINGEANKKNDDAIVEKELDSTPVKKVEVAVVLEPKEPMKAGAAVAKQPAPKPELNLDATHVRRVILTNLPADLELKDIFALVWGGRVQNLRYNKGDRTCGVLFLTTDSCRSFCHSAAGGIPWTKDHTRLITIESVEELEPNDFEAGLAATKVSRCVRITGMPKSLTPLAIRNAAFEGNRVVERILTGKFGHEPAIQIQFAGMLDAIRFYTKAQDDPVFKGCVFVWAEDPCVKANGPRYTRFD